MSNKEQEDKITDDGKLNKNIEDKDLYIQQLEAKLKEWNAKIEKHKAQMEQASIETKAHYRLTIKNLEEKVAEGQEKLSELKESNSNAWKEIKKGVDRAVDDIKHAFEKAKTKFKK